MRKKTLFAALLLCSALMILSTALAGCNGRTEESTGGASDDETEVKNVEVIDFASSDYTIIRADSITDDTELEASQLIMKFLTTDEYRPKYETDYVQPKDDPDAKNEYEILVGMTNRSATGEVYSKLGENEFAIAVVGKRLVCVGYTSNLTKTAAEVLIDRYLSGGKLEIGTDVCDIYEAEPQITYEEVKNPVYSSGADPWVIRDGDRYYYCYSCGNGVCVNEIESPSKITTDGGIKVYTAPEGTSYSKEYWAPELHKIDGKWYIYVAADDGDNFNHRMYVLECTGDKPTDDFVMLGKITDSTDKWAIDGTVLQYKDELYFIWSGWEGDINVRQQLYIAHMSSPSEIDGERVLLSKPEYRWEKQGGTPFINEGPVTVIDGDVVHLIYSASGSWSDYYCLGKITFSGGDILNPDDWVKSEEAAFEKTDCVFGPGHCSFTTAQDGSLWMVYHANLVSGTGWSGRSVWIQPVTLEDGDIVLGEPDPDAVLHYPAVGYSKDKVKLK